MIPHLIARGLSVAVVKHDAHGFNVDKEGKDSDRFFRAGATVALCGPVEQFQRRSADAGLSLEAILADLARDHDLLLVEGHRSTLLPKLWLCSKGDSVVPPEVTNVLYTLPWNSDRITFFLSWIERWLAEQWLMRPIYAGLLVGGKSSRMGRPKQMISFGSCTLGEIAASALSEQLHAIAPVGNTDLHPRLLVLGNGPLPAYLSSSRILPDIPELEGPGAGLLAAHRWSPRAAWMISACDHPWVRAKDFEILYKQRRPGLWAILSRQNDGHPCPTLALYEPQALSTLENIWQSSARRCIGLTTLIEHRRTWINPYSSDGPVNVNTPQELMTILELMRLREHPEAWKLSTNRYKPQRKNDVSAKATTLASNSLATGELDEV